MAIIFFFYSKLPCYLQISLCGAAILFDSTALRGGIEKSIKGRSENGKAQ